MMYGGYGGVWGWVLMAVMMLVFWGGIIALVVFLVRGARSGPGGYGQGGPWHEDPEQIRAQRFARGEIDETEFRARRDALRRRP
ncbi:SHOCT domain-containing protein [Sinomonas sp. RB5]